MVLFIFSRSLKSIAVLRLTKIVKITTEAFFQEVFRKKLFLEISENLQENTRAKVSGLKLYWKIGFDIGVSCEFCEISKNTFFYRAPQVAASVTRIVKITTKHECLFPTCNFNIWFSNIYIKLILINLPTMLLNNIIK